MIRFEDYILLAHKVARKRHKQYGDFYEYDDLFQIACMGLLKAIKNFDEEKANFITYAYLVIDRNILMAIRNDKWAMTEAGSRINSFRDSVPASLDIEVQGKDKNTTFLELLEGESLDEDYCLLRVALDGLPLKLKRVLYLSYFVGLSRSEISHRLGVHPNTIARHRRAALDLLKEELS